MAYTIGKLAKAIGANVESIRFYHRRGLLPLPERQPGCVRVYTVAHLHRLQTIRLAQSYGFTLEQIKSAIRLLDRPCCVTHRYATRKRLEVRQKLRLLREFDRALRTWIDYCEAQPDASVISAVRALGIPIDGPDR